MGIDQIRMHLPKAVKERRKELRLSIDDVAKRAGTTKSHVWEIEAGRSVNPTIGMMMALCGALSISLNELLGVDVSQPSFTEQEMALIAAHRQIFGKAP